jgi:formylglycine-generating enzyme required for sulfatase activity
VSITGTAKVGETLTADTSALGGTGTISYRWFRGDAEIANANNATYVPVSADVGQTIKVKVGRAGNTGEVVSPTFIVVGTDGFYTPAQYRTMVLATPDATNTVTITGDAAYNSNLFIANRTVILSPFKIAKYETTYELWYEVKTWATSNGYDLTNAGQEGFYGNGITGAAPTGHKLEPVTSINWRDAVIWCNAYSEMSGKEPVYYMDSSYTTVLKQSTESGGSATWADTAVMKPGADGYRLPTEAEWEYAARGGGTPAATGSFVYAYSGSDTIEDVAWYSGNAGTNPHPAGGKTANTAGIYDMSGNVWEWCWDWYNSISTGSETDPHGPVNGVFRVLRGGSWYDLATFCTVANRNNSSPSSRYYGYGFRVVSP